MFVGAESSGIERTNPSLYLNLTLRERGRGTNDGSTYGLLSDSSTDVSNRMCDPPLLPPGVCVSSSPYPVSEYIGGSPLFEAMMGCNLAFEDERNATSKLFWCSNSHAM